MIAASTQESVPIIKETVISNGEAMPQALDEKKESPSADGYIQHEAPMHGIPTLMNGMPPSQVYVDTTMGYHPMAAMESQFHGLGINDAHDSTNLEDSEGNDATGEGSNDEDPVKLFIGQVRILLPRPDVIMLFLSTYHFTNLSFMFRCPSQ